MTEGICPECKGDGRIQKFLDRTFSNRCPECDGYGRVSATHSERLVVIAADQSLPNYKPDPIWKRFTSMEVEQNMVEQGWKKIEGKAQQVKEE